MIERLVTRVAVAFVVVDAVRKAIRPEKATIVPGTVTIKLDGRTLSEAVVKYTLQRAARGPSTLSGDHLVSSC